MQMQADSPNESIMPAVFRDGRILQGIAQLIFVFVIILLINNLSTRINTALESTNQSPNFEFLQNRAGFDIADSGDYSSRDSYIDAFRVGFINTLRVVLLGLGGDNGHRYPGRDIPAKSQFPGPHLCHAPMSKSCATHPSFCR